MAIINPVRPAEKGNDQVPAGSLVEQDFRMACRDDLISVLPCHVVDQVISLTLAKKLQMSVRFVQQQDCSRVGVHIGEQQQGLL